MNNMNFFGWIRDGVRQSVLLGVSDAIEQLGTPAAAEDLHPSVSGFLHLDRGAADAPRLAGAAAGGNAGGNSSGGQRKRLGKSLKDMGQETPS